jgi:hypothetical protein
LSQSNRIPVSEVQWTKPDDYVPEHENKFGQPDEPASTTQPEETSATETHTEESEEASAQDSTQPEPDPCNIPLPTHEIPLPPPPGTTPAPSAPEVAPEAAPEAAPEPERMERKRTLPSNEAYGGWEQLPEPTQ